MGTTQTKVFKPGTRLEFIKEHLNPDNTPTVEARRLLPLMIEAGFKTTEMSVTQAIGVARRRMGLKPLKAAVGGWKKIKKNTTSRIQQNPRATALTSYLNDAMNGLTLLKGEIKRLQEIEKKYLAIKAQIER